MTVQSVNPPLMSFLMITYNQEQYVRAALESALAQEYPSLEIIVCDDCSSDRTFEVAAETAAAYHGPHKILLRRNKHNLGIGANFQEAYSMSSGEWLSMAAGDDISMPYRCRAIAEAILSHPNALAFAGDIEVIDGKGRRLGYQNPSYSIAPGACISWNRRVFSEFPPLGTSLKVEDIPLLTRVFFLGGNYVKLPRLLLKYRFDGHSFIGLERNSAAKVKHFQIKTCSVISTCVEARLLDLEALNMKHHVADFERQKARQQWLLDELGRELSSLRESLRVMEAGFFERMRYLIDGSGIYRHESFRYRLWNLMVSNRFLVRLKHLLIRRKRTPEFIKKLLPNMPKHPVESIITPEHYLTHDDCDYFKPLDSGSFQRNYLANFPCKTDSQ